MTGDLPPGWTAERITMTARLAASNARFRPRDLLYEDAMTVAWEAVATGLAEGVTGLVPLLRRANIALTQEQRDQRKLRGDLAHTGQPNRRHAAFWHGSRSLAESFADELTERLAVVQVYRALPAHHQEVLLREAWGYDRHLHYRSEVQRARAIARRLWFDHETDPGHYHRRRTA